tara:strand:- start:1503 stop:1892 length:390 start_codon:yes stop_codon:yes gene_type:complete
MKNIYSYTVYNKSTGKIRKNIYAASEDTIENYFNSSTEAVISGDFDPENYKIVNETPVLLEPEAIDYSYLNKIGRNAALVESDWTQVPDSPLSDSKKAEWATYRQALRDITTHSNWPDLEDADWPTQPT